MPRRVGSKREGGRQLTHGNGAHMRELAPSFSAATVLPNLQSPHNFNVSTYLLAHHLVLWCSICEFSAQPGYCKRLSWWLTHYDSHKPLHSIQQGSVGLPNIIDMSSLCVLVAETRILHNDVHRCFTKPKNFEFLFNCKWVEQLETGILWIGFRSSIWKGSYTTTDRPTSIQAHRQETDLPALW